MKEIIDKAVRGGYSKEESKHFMKELECWNIDSAHFKVLVTAFIFTHEFLRAYFGEKEIKFNLNTPPKGFHPFTDYKPAWQYHAQQLVLSEDRLEYLRRYL